MLPLHATVWQALDAYLEVRQTMAFPDLALFVSAAGKPLPYNTVRGAVCISSTVAASRVHTLGEIRESTIAFAVRSLEQCPHDHAAVGRHTVALSTYLGHAHVTDTYWYLQAAPALMKQIAAASEALLMVSWTTERRPILTNCATSTRSR